MLSFHFTNALSFLLSLCPKQALVFLSHGFAFFLFSMLRLRRTLVLKNLDIVYGAKKTSSQKKKIAYLSYFNFFLTCFEFLAERHGRLGAEVEIINRQHIDQAKQKNKGVYILCIHMGSWEAMGGAFTRLFGPSHIVVKAVGPKGMDQFVTALRHKNGFYSVKKDKKEKKGHTLRQIEEKLCKNEIIGFVIDQKRPKSPKIPFFGELAKTNTTLAYLWQKNQAPIIPAFITRSKVGKHTVEVFPEIKLERGVQQEQDLLEHSKIFNQVVEKMILSCPEQYFWLHNRWGLK